MHLTLSHGNKQLFDSIPLAKFRRMYKENKERIMDHTGFGIRQYTKENWSQELVKIGYIKAVSENDTVMFNVDGKNFGEALHAGQVRSAHPW